jgi:type IV secretory pathway TrbL component
MKHNLPKRLVRGKTYKSQEAKAPSIGGSGGMIDTRLRDIDINWTPAKLRIVMTVLIAPVVTAIIVSFNAGNILVGLILIGLILFVGLMYLALRYIDGNEF